MSSKMPHFTVPKTEGIRFQKWLDKQNDIVMRKWAKNGHNPFGAIGGACTFKFTPTGLGTIIKVEHNLTKDEVDLTDYEQF